MNSTILARIVGVGQESVQPLEPVRAALRTSATELASAAASQDGANVERLAGELGTSAAGASVLLDATHGLLAQFEDQLGADQLQRLDEARTTLGSIRTMAGNVATSVGEARATGAAELTTAVEQLDSQLAELQSVDPAVLVQPFVGTTRVALGEPVGITDFFAPAAIALLVQHLGVTFGALTFVRDRALGLFEVLRVGPVTALQSLLGKYVAYTMIGAVVAAALAALVVLGLDVPLVGTVGWVAGVLALVLVSSLGIGFVASLMAGSDSQAVQFAMIVLLASLFFGGFFLDLERLTYPVEAISLVLPVRYGISALQDVMLRGIAPSTFDLTGLVTLTVVGFGTVVDAAAATAAGHLTCCETTSQRRAFGWVLLIGGSLGLVVCLVGGIVGFIALGSARRASVQGLDVTQEALTSLRSTIELADRPRRLGAGRPAGGGGHPRSRWPRRSTPPTTCWPRSKRWPARCRDRSTPPAARCARWARWPR